jgi:hypothetical protein
LYNLVLFLCFWDPLQNKKSLSLIPTFWNISLCFILVVSVLGLIFKSLFYFELIFLSSACGCSIFLTSCIKQNAFSPLHVLSTSIKNIKIQPHTDVWFYCYTPFCFSGFMAFPWHFDYYICSIFWSQASCFALFFPRWLWVFFVVPYKLLDCFSFFFFKNAINIVFIVVMGGGTLCIYKSSYNLSKMLLVFW